MQHTKPESAVVQVYHRTVNKPLWDIKRAECNKGDRWWRDKSIPLASSAEETFTQSILFAQSFYFFLILSSCGALNEAVEALLGFNKLALFQGYSVPWPSCYEGRCESKAKWLRTVWRQRFAIWMVCVCVWTDWVKMAVNRWCDSVCCSLVSEALEKIGGWE